MTAAGWIFMSASLAIMWGLSAWCFYLLSSSPAKDSPAGESALPGRTPSRPEQVEGVDGD